MSENEIEIRVAVRDSAAAIAQIKAVQAAAAAGARTSLDLDAPDLREKVIEAVRAAERNIAVIVGIDLDAPDLRERVIEAVKAAEKGVNVIVGIDADDDGLRERVKADAAAAGAGVKIKVPLEADGGALRRSGSAKPDPIKVPVELDGDPFEREFRAAMDEAKSASEDADKAIARSFGDVEKASRTARSAVGELSPAADEAGRALDDAGKKASGAGSGANNAGGGFAFLHSRFVLLGGAALAVGPALAAVPAVMGAAAAGAGVMGLAFGGIITALHDYGAATASSGQSSASLAATAFSNAVAIRGAQQGIDDARRQSAIATQNSADSVAAAVQHLAGAQQSDQLATESLNQAWRDASNILKDLNNNAADAANSVADAQLAETAALDANNKAKNNSLLTDFQKKQAAQALIDAQQHLVDAQQHATEAQGAADDANAKGLAGSTAVVAAQRAQAASAQGVTDAQHALVVAQRNAAEQQRSSAEQVSKAVQGLADMYRQQQLAAEAAAASGSAGANKFAADMAKLTPVGQAAVLQILALKGGMKDLSAVAQNTTLPGFMAMLRGASGMGPQVTSVVSGIGTGIGRLFAQLGQLMQSPVFRGQLAQIFKDGLDFANQFGSAVVPMIAGMTAAFAQAGPIVAGIGAGFHTLMASGIPAFFQGLTVNAGGAGQTLSGLLTLVSNLLGPIGTLAGSLAGALGPAMQVLASPDVAKALASIATSLGAVFVALGPVVTMLAQGLAGALRIAAPLLASFAKFLQDNHRWLSPLAQILTAVAAAWWLVNIAMAANPIVLITGLIAGLVLGLIYCWEKFKGFRDFVKEWWPELLAIFTFGASELIGHFSVIKDWVVKEVPKAFGVLLDFVKEWWPELLAPFTFGVSEIVGHWDTILEFVKGLPAKLANAGLHLWDWATAGISTIGGTVEGVFKLAINGVIGAFNWAVDQLNGATHALSDAWSWAGVPSIPPIGHIGTLKAAGGVASGLVGMNEAGAEMVRLPTGSVVMPHANTASALAQGGSPAGPIRLEWVGPVGDELFTMIKRWIRVNHGTGPDSVQRALGQ